MKERGILFSAPMVRAILAGAKTQTRRLVTPQPEAMHTVFPKPPDGEWYWKCSRLGAGYTHTGGDAMRRQMEGVSPFGVPGDRLWVREKCRAREQADGLDGVQYFADDTFRPIDDTSEAAARWLALNHYGGKRRGMNVPGIHMPRWASRITLKVTGIRVQRLHDITAKDIIAEGAVVRFHDDQFGHNPVSRFDAKVYLDLQSLWAAGWASIHGAASWDANPWVWVVEFRRC